MKLPQDSGAPPYRLVADAIRKMIRSGQLAPGERVPSSRELEAEYEIANMTARSSLRLLRDEGLIYSVPGRGNFVADPLPSEAPPVGAGRNASGEGRLGSAEYEQLTARLDELSERVDHLMSVLESLTERLPGPPGEQ
ncbi:GntR family transcriptional regulator [Streptomyces sp. URMC 129]|uniref:GntR family transcriptional regulator n=1 Tax=Streptomyces sp. URMC 129 TaxID=3423407 RepID=UPI003F1C30A4